MKEIDKVIDLMDGTSCHGNVIPHFKHECKQLSKSKFAYQWLIAEWLKIANYFWEFHELNKKYIWWLK